MRVFWTILSQLGLSLLFTAIFLFIGINWVIGCEDWSQEECVTPEEYLEILVPW